MSGNGENQKIIDKFDGTEYAFLSNFYPCDFVYDGITYHNSEAAFQAAKTFDMDFRQQIANESSPAAAKRLGRSLKIRPDWEEVKREVMHDVVYAKFSQNRDLLRRLLETDGAVLIEGNTWHDNCWGDCTCPKCSHINGTNWLGKTLMQVRAELS